VRAKEITPLVHVMHERDNAHVWVGVLCVCGGGIGWEREREAEVDAHSYRLRAHWIYS
jgi:hypothetical protein